VPAQQEVLCQTLAITHSHPHPIFPRKKENGLAFIMKFEVKFYFINLPLHRRNLYFSFRVNVLVKFFQSTVQPRCYTLFSLFHLLAVVILASHRTDSRSNLFFKMIYAWYDSLWIADMVSEGAFNSNYIYERISSTKMFTSVDFHNSIQLFVIFFKMTDIPFFNAYIKLKRKKKSFTTVKFHVARKSNSHTTHSTIFNII